MNISERRLKTCRMGLGMILIGLWICVSCTWGSALEVAGFFGEDWSVENGDFAWAHAQAQAPKDRALPADVGPDPRGFVHPRGYVCHRTTGPLEIDGRLHELAWTKAAWTEPFGDIQGTRDAPAPRFQTRAKMLWDDKCLYIGAVLEDPHV